VGLSGHEIRQLHSLLRDRTTRGQGPVIKQGVTYPAAASCQAALVISLFSAETSVWMVLH